MQKNVPTCTSTATPTICTKNVQKNAEKKKRHAIEIYHHNTTEDEWQYRE